MVLMFGKLEKNMYPILRILPSEIDWYFFNSKILPRKILDKHSSYISMNVIYKDVLYER